MTVPTNRRNHRPMLSAWAMAASLVLGGCAHESTGGSQVASQPTSTAGAAQVLAGLVGELRSTVDEVMATANYQDHPGGRDFDSPCGEEDWPSQHIFTRTFRTKEDDSRPVADAMLVLLESKGWTVNRNMPGASDTEGSAVAVSNGFSISIESGATAGGISLEGGTPCVSADGSVDRTNPS